MFWADDSILSVRTAMLVEHASSLPQGSDWEFEYSWPGDRVLAFKDEARVRLTAATQPRDLTNRFPVAAAMLAKLPATAFVLEGVVATIEPWQSSAFPDVPPTNALSAGVAAVRLIAMDLLWLNTDDARQWTLAERRRRLRALVRGTGILFSASPARPPADVLGQARSVGADGILAQRRDSRYRPFGRNGDWVRVPLQPSPAGRRTVPVTRLGDSRSPFGFGAGGFGFGQMA